MSGGSNSLIAKIYGGGIRFFSAIGASTYVALRIASNPTANLDIKLLTSLPPSVKVLTIDQNGQIATGASDGTGGGGGEANTASSPSVAVGAVGIYWKKVGVDLQFYKLLPLNTPALTIAAGIDTLDISIANAVASGNAGLLTGADKAKLDGIASGATVGATWGTNLSSIPTKISTIAGVANPAAVQFMQLNTDGTITFVNVSTLQTANNRLSAISSQANPAAIQTPQLNTDGTISFVNSSTFQASNARLTAIAGFTNPTSVKLIQVDTNGIATLVDPPSGFNPGSQSANVFYASPNGAAGNPTFRALTYGDVSGIVGSAASTLAAGNDSRFHARNQDTGTNSTSFIIDSGGTPLMIKDVSGEFQFRNGADTANAPLRLGDVIITGNLTMTGSTTMVSPETVQIQDNIFEINSDFTTGTASQDLGIVGKRGSAVDAEMIFNETTDTWECGIVGERWRIARTRSYSFTNANLVSGVLSVAHNLKGRPSAVGVWDNNQKMIGLVDDIIYVDVNNIQIDITSAGTITGTWSVSVTV